MLAAFSGRRRSPFRPAKTRSGTTNSYLDSSLICDSVSVRGRPRILQVRSSGGQRRLPGRPARRPGATRDADLGPVPKIRATPYNPADRWQTGASLDESLGLHADAIRARADGAYARQRDALAVARARLQKLTLAVVPDSGR